MERGFFFMAVTGVGLIAYTIVLLALAESNFGLALLGTAAAIPAIAYTVNQTEDGAWIPGLRYRDGLRFGAVWMAGVWVALSILAAHAPFPLEPFFRSMAAIGALLGVPMIIIGLSLFIAGGSRKELPAW